MTKITVSDAGGTWSVRTQDGVLVESREAKSLVEGAMDAVIYFPKADVAMALLEPSDSSTRCPHKGTATYYNYVGQSGTVPDIAWVYESVTNPDAKGIEGHLAFYAQKATVEQI
jgi:uncharacterized protein (DUF427 family)